MYFLQSLKDFDKDNIPSTLMKKIRSEYLPNKDFKPHIVAKASSAAEGLCKWVMAMDMYDAVKKVCSSHLDTSSFLLLNTHYQSWILRNIICNNYLLFIKVCHGEIF